MSCIFEKARSSNFLNVVNYDFFIQNQVYYICGQVTFEYMKIPNNTKPPYQLLLITSNGHYIYITLHGKVNSVFPDNDN